MKEATEKARLAAQRIGVQRPATALTGPDPDDTVCHAATGAYHRYRNYVPLTLRFPEMSPYIKNRE